MSRSRSHSFGVKLHVVVTLPVEEAPQPVLTEQNLSDPDESFDAAMDYLFPQDGNAEIMRQAQRCLLTYIDWLVDEAPARYPSWAKDELQRAVRRLIEVDAAAAKTACRTLH